jgi:RNA recognition motif-containing protein
MRIYVGRLALTTSEQELHDVFQPYKPQSVAIITDRETGESRGFGFVEIQDPAQGRQAIADLDGKDLGGRAIQVNEAKERNVQSAPSGGRPARW